MGKNWILTLSNSDTFQSPSSSYHLQYFHQKNLKQQVIRYSMFLIKCNFGMAQKIHSTIFCCNLFTYTYTGCGLVRAPASCLLNTQEISKIYEFKMLFRGSIFFSLFFEKKKWIHSINMRKIHSENSSEILGVRIASYILCTKASSTWT